MYRLCILSGTSLPLVTEIKYVGIHINYKSFGITTEQSRRHFYRDANAIIGRIGKIATERFYTCCAPNVGLCQFCYMASRLVQWRREAGSIRGTCLGWKGLCSGGLDWIEQGLASHSTHFRSFRRNFRVISSGGRNGPKLMELTQRLNC